MHSKQQSLTNTSLEVIKELIRLIILKFKPITLVQIRKILTGYGSRTLYLQKKDARKHTQFISRYPNGKKKKKKAKILTMINQVVIELTLLLVKPVKKVRKSIICLVQFLQLSHRASIEERWRNTIIKQHYHQYFINHLFSTHHKAFLVEITMTALDPIQCFNKDLRCKPKFIH